MTDRLATLPRFFPDYTVDDIAWFYDEVKRLREANRWIPVAEQSPPYDEVILYYSCGDGPDYWRPLLTPGEGLDDG